MKRLNDEQLSRVLSALAVGHLHYVSAYDISKPEGGCLMQVANADLEPYANQPESGWFDRNMPAHRDPDAFLAAMEKAGIA